MVNKEEYNKAYKSTHGYSPSTSLYDLCKDIKRGDVLELGCGEGRLLPGSTCVDFSQIAINKATENFKDTTFICSDALDYLRSTTMQYDLIIDSHLIHCLNPQSVDCYLSLVYSHLSDHGNFVIETMIESKSLVLSTEEIYDRYQRNIFNYLNFEKLLLKVGFKINYFYMPFGVKMILERGRELAVSEDPDVLRVIVSRGTDNNF